MARASTMAGSVEAATDAGFSHSLRRAAASASCEYETTSSAISAA
jgi:hypothetical protein